MNIFIYNNNLIIVFKLTHGKIPDRYYKKIELSNIIKNLYNLIGQKGNLLLVILCNHINY